MYRGLVVKAGRVSLETKESDEIVVTLNPQLARSFECPPQPRRKRGVVRELRIVPAEISAQALDESPCIDLGKRGYLLRRQFKHADAPSLVRH